MHGSSSATNPKANYKCRNRYALNKGDLCEGTSARALPIDDLIADVLIELLSLARSRRKALAGLTRRRDGMKTDRRLLQGQEATFRRRMAELREQRNSGLFDYDGGTADWESDFKDVRDRLNEVLTEQAQAEEEGEPIPIAALDEWLKAPDVRAMWNKRTTAQRREVARALIERVEVLPPDPTWRHRHFDGRRISVKWRGGVMPSEKKTYV